MKRININLKLWNIIVIIMLISRQRNRILLKLVSIDKGIPI